MPVPADLPGLRGWYDGRDAASFALVGSAITQWGDKSGGARHLLPPGVADQRPTLTAEDGVRFDANFNQQLTAVTPITGATWTFSVACLVDEDCPHNRRVLCLGTPGQADWGDPAYAQIVSLTYQSGYYPQMWRAGGGDMFVPNADAKGEWHVVTVVFDGTNSFMYLDGVQVDTAPETNAFNATQMTVGVDGSGVEERLFGNVGEIVICNVALSAPDRTGLDNYLINKWISSRVASGPRLLERGVARITEGGVQRVLEPYVEVPKAGSGVVTWSNSTAAVGKRTQRGTGTATWTYSTVAVGKRAPKATATTAWTYTLVAAGKRLQKGTATTAWTEALAAAGKKAPRATALTAHQWSSSSTGAKPAVASKQGMGLIPWSASMAGVGKRAPKATVTTTWTEAPTAVGKRSPKAAATTQWTEALASVGKRIPKAAGITSWTEVIAAAGKRVARATATLGWIGSLAAVGRRSPKGSAIGSHTWLSIAAGTFPPRAVGVTAHTWEASAVGDNAPWNPTLLDGLAIWFDASQLVGYGEIEFAWEDLSGRGNHGYIFHNPNPVVRAPGLSGMPVVRFKVGEGRVRMYNTGFDDDWTLAYVGRMVGPAPGRVVTGIYTPNNILIGYWNGFQDVMYDNGFAAPNTQTAWTTDWKLYSADGSVLPSQHSRLLSDGVLLGTISTAQGWGGTFAINGYDPDAGSETCDCEVAEVVMFDRKLAEDDRTKVEDYLRLKWMSAPAAGSAGFLYAQEVSVIGQRAPLGTVTTTYTEVLAAIGKLMPKAAAITTWAETLTSAGKRVARASGTTTYTESLAVVGKRVPKGNRTINNVWATAAIGFKPVVPMNQGAGATQWATAQTSIGKRAPKGQAMSLWTEVVAANGKKPLRGTATLPWAANPFTAGKRTPKSTVTTPWLNTVGATGSRTPKAASTTAHDWSMVVQGVRPLPGVHQGSGLTNWRLSTQGGVPGALGPSLPVTDGLGLWLEADKIPGAVDGAAVMAWPDGSVAGRHAVPIAAPPAWRADVDGHPAVEFNASRMLVPGWGTALSGKTEYTMFQVIHQRFGYGNYPVITTAPSNNLWSWITEYDASAGVYWGHGNGHFRMFHAAVPPNTMQMFSYRFSPAGPRFYMGDTEITVYNLGNSGDLLPAVPNIGPDVVLGGYYEGSYWIDGYISAMVWYDRALSEVEYEAVRSYLHTKWFTPSVGGGGDPTAGWAIGKREPKGGNAIPVTWATTAAGTTEHRGAATTSYAYTAAAVGKRMPKATGSIPYHYTATAVGKRAPKGVAALTNAHKWIVFANGIKPEVPFLKGNGITIHQWPVAAVGKRTPKAEGTGAHTWTQAAAGKKFQNGTAAPFTYQWTLLAAGSRWQSGAASFTYLWEMPIASGSEMPEGSGDSDYWFSQVAIGSNGIEAWWNGQLAVAMYWGDTPVLDWLLITT